MMCFVATYSELPAETPINGCSAASIRLTNVAPVDAPSVTGNHQTTSSMTVPPNTQQSQHAANNEAGKLHPGRLLEDLLQLVYRRSCKSVGRGDGGLSPTMVAG